MQVVRATRRVSVAMVLGVGRIGCAGGRECEGIRVRGEAGKETWSNSVEGWQWRVAGRKHVTWVAHFTCTTPSI
jgi:hypothetical protein